MWRSTTPCSYIFLNLLHFLYQFRYRKYSDLKMENFRSDPEKSLLRYIKSLVTKYQIWHPWAMAILRFFSFWIKTFFQIWHSWAIIILWVFFLDNIYVYIYIYSTFLFSVFHFIWFFFWLAAMGHLDLSCCALPFHFKKLQFRLWCSV